LASEDRLPCRIKFVIEGEEEIGSVHMHEFVKQNRARLKGDACLWEFGYVDHRDVPLQFAGLRGICYVELSVESLSRDVHSGIGGSIFPNAAWRLTWALASLKGPDERIRIPGFYDPVRPPTARDKELMALAPDMAEDHETRYGVKQFLKGLKGGAELSIAEVFEPTCTICGLTSTGKDSTTCGSSSSAGIPPDAPTRTTRSSGSFRRRRGRSTACRCRSCRWWAAPAPTSRSSRNCMYRSPRRDSATPTRAPTRRMRTNGSIST